MAAITMSANVRAEKMVQLLLSWTAAVVLAVLLVHPAMGKPAESTNVLAKYKLNQCKLSDPELNNCLKESSKEYQKFSKTGSPELGIPKYEPYVIEELDLKSLLAVSSSLFGTQNTDKFKVYSRNIVFHHVSEFIINDVNLKTDIEKPEFFIDISFPRLKINADYDINLIMFNTPVKATGPVTVNTTDVVIKATMSGKMIKRKDGTYLLFDTIDIKMGIKDYSIKLESLFNKYPTLNEALDETMKSQKSEMKKLMMPMMEEISGKMFLETMNKIMSSYPLEELFLPE